jgi:hypothetical protein
MRPSALAPTEPAGPERRAQPRFAGPTPTIDLDGHSYRTDNWSLGGFRLCALHRAAVPGERLAESPATRPAASPATSSPR